MRIFIYVNINPTQKHITIHCENKGPCPHILQQILSQNVSNKCSIQDISKNKSIIKIGVTTNSYWILVYVDNCDQVKKKISDIDIIKNILNKYNISNVTLCSKCS